MIAISSTMSAVRLRDPARGRADGCRDRPAARRDRDDRRRALGRFALAARTRAAPHTVETWVPEQLAVVVRRIRRSTALRFADEPSAGASVRSRALGCAPHATHAAADENANDIAGTPPCTGVALATQHEDPEPCLCLFHADFVGGLHRPRGVASPDRGPRARLRSSPALEWPVLRGRPPRHHGDHRYPQVSAERRVSWRPAPWPRCR